MKYEKAYFESLKENERVELKSSTTSLPKSIYQTYSSFANTKGGTIYLGIKEGEIVNEIVGVNNPHQMIKDFFNTLNDSHKCSVNVLTSSNIEVVDIEDKQIIIINVPEAPYYLKPVYLNQNLNLVFLRNFDGDYQADEMIINSMIVEKSTRRMDTLVNKYKYRLEDLNQDSLSAYKNAYYTLYPEAKTIDDLTLFERLGVIKPLDEDKDEKYVTNGGILLFGYEHQISNIYPSYFLDYQENISSLSKYDYRLNSDSLSFSGNIFDFLNLVLPRLTSTINNSFKLEGYVNVANSRLLEAIREGIINALCNADYLLPQGVCIIRTKNTIEIKNRGLLRVSLSQALKGGESNPRNPFLQQMFERINMCEKAGTGIPKIFDIFKQENLPAPSLLEDKEGQKTVLTLYLPSNVETPILESSHSSKIINFLIAHPDGVSLKEVSDYLDLALKYTSSLLSKLVKANIVGETKKGKGKKFFIKR